MFGVILKTVFWTGGRDVRGGNGESNGEGSLLHASTQALQKIILETSYPVRVEKGAKHIETRHTLTFFCKCCCPRPRPKGLGDPSPSLPLPHSTCPSLVLV